MWPDETRNQQGLKELSVLLDRKPPVDDIETLHLLDTIADAKGESEPRLRQVWQKAAGARPQDEKLHMVWFRSKFQAGNLRAAQQASQSWMKNFPKSRDPFFFYILTMHRLAEDLATPESERTLLRSLAYKFLSKAASEAPDRAEDRPIRAINTLEDLLLLLRVYRAQEKYSEAAAILTDPRIGVGSPLGGNSWELIRQLIELFELSHRWGDVFQLCQQLLIDARDEYLGNPRFSLTHYTYGKLGDDWKVWQALIAASSNIGSQQ